VRAATFCSAFRPGCLVSGGAGDNIVRVWDCETQACVGKMPALSDHVQALSTFPHDPALLMAGRSVGTPRGLNVWLRVVGHWQSVTLLQQEWINRGLGPAHAPQGV
jgi:hypothetical protein